MILEVAALDVVNGSENQFEEAFKEAEGIIRSSPGYVMHELHRCVEAPGRYLLLVRWERLEDHIAGFRKSPDYDRWRKLLHGFYQPAPRVERYREVGST